MHATKYIYKRAAPQHTIHKRHQSANRHYAPMSSTCLLCNRKLRIFFASKGTHHDGKFAALSSIIACEHNYSSLMIQSRYTFQCSFVISTASAASTENSASSAASWSANMPVKQGTEELSVHFVLLEPG